MTIELSVRSEDLTVGLAAALHAASKDMLVPGLNGVALYRRSDGGLSFLATDRFKMAIVNAARGEDAAPGEGALIGLVTRDSIKLIASWVKVNIPAQRYGSPEVELTEAGGQLSVRFGDTSMTVGLIEGFPVAVLRIAEDAARSASLEGATGAYTSQNLAGVTAMAKTLKADTIWEYGQGLGKPSLFDFDVAVKAKHSLRACAVLMPLKVYAERPIDMWAAQG